jgi:hypothetical protein
MDPLGDRAVGRAQKNWTSSNCPEVNRTLGSYGEAATANMVEAQEEIVYLAMNGREYGRRNGAKTIERVVGAVGFEPTTSTV